MLPFSLLDIFRFVYCNTTERLIEVGHPVRKPKRERRKQRQKMLARRNLYDQTLDLTLYNAVGPMVKGEDFAIKYK